MSGGERKPCVLHSGEYNDNFTGLENCSGRTPRNSRTSTPNKRQLSWKIPDKALVFKSPEASYDVFRKELEETPKRKKLRGTRKPVQNIVGGHLDHISSQNTTAIKLLNRIMETLDTIDNGNNNTLASITEYNFEETE